MAPPHLRYVFAARHRAENISYNRFYMRLPHHIAVAFGLRHRMTTRARAADAQPAEVSIVPAFVHSNIFAHASTSSLCCYCCLLHRCWSSWPACVT